MSHGGSAIRGPLAHHDGSALYVSSSRPEIGDDVDVLVRTSDELSVEALHVRQVVDGEPNYAQAWIDRKATGETWWRMTLEIAGVTTSYRFLLETPRGLLWLNAQGLHRHDIPDAADFRLTTHHAPSWASDAVIYEVFPDRYARSDTHPITHYPDWAIPTEWDEPVAYDTPAGVRQVYGGTLWGVSDHLEHIRALGANVIYLTPFFPARSNHRYDASSFDHVDPLLGGDEALRTVVQRAHELGMRVIGDITLNHSGDSHPWFVAGRACPNSTEAGFYYFDPDDRDTYATFEGVKTLPKFDHRSEELRRRLYADSDSVVGHYLADFGLDGWRVDVAQSVGRHGEIDLNRDAAELTRRTVDEVGTDALLLAEHQFDASDSLQGSGWHGTMAYAGFTRPVWSWLAQYQVQDAWGTPGGTARYGGREMAQTMRDFAATVPWQSFVSNMTLLDSHDIPRFRSMAGRELQRLGVALLMTLPGIPSVFSGDEVGVEGVHLEDARRPFPWDPDDWDVQTYTLYRSLIALRHEHPALRRGGLRWLYADDDVVVFERALEGEVVIVEVSRSTHPAPVSTVAATSLLDGPDLHPGVELPCDGPAFHIWRVD